MIAPVRMTIHAALDEIRDSFFVVFFGQFTLIVAVEAGETAGSRRMAGGAYAIGAIVINREGMVEIGWQPPTGAVTVRALA